MTAQDREQFQSFVRRQISLEGAFQQLRAEFQELERRVASTPEIIAEPPPLPALAKQPPPVPLIPPPVVAPIIPASRPLPFEAAALPPTPILEAVPEPAAAQPPLPALPEFQPAPEIPKAELQPEPAQDKPANLEFQLGRWLARIGVVFALITLISFSTLAYKSFYNFMGPWSKLTVLALISTALVATGLRLERRNPKLTVYGRTLAGGGLACLYYTLYGASYVSQLQVITSPLFGGLLLLAWSAYVLYLAEQKKSELLSVFAIALAYFSSAITPVGGFTMVANLLLSATAVVFLVRNAWTGLSYLCLVGTYFGLLRQFVAFDGSAAPWFSLATNVAFAPAATYLTGAWIIYTAGVFLATTPNFAAGKRMAFLCLNNGALIGLLLIASSLSGFGHLGPILGFTGLLFLATSYLARSLRTDFNEIAGAYLMQGLALGTGGVVIAYTGVTRGLLITVESVFLVAAGAYARNLIFRIAGYLSAFLGIAFVLAEIVAHAPHAWILIAGGAAAMLTNAWLSRREFWREPVALAAQRFVASSAYYILLAISLLSLGTINSPLSEASAASVMAVTAVALTFAVYIVPLFELPLLIQLLMVVAIYFGTLPLDDSHPLATEALVALATMTLVAWWPRQKLIPTGAWLVPMQIVYAFGMTALAYCAVHPHVDAQGWMIAASLLSAAFLLYGIYARTWPFAVVGQILLAVSLNAFFSGFIDVFPWTWWAAAVPIATTFFSAWLVQEWLRKSDDLAPDSALRPLIRAAVYFYQALTVALIVRLVFGLVPDVDIPLCFDALATALIVWNLKWPSSMGLRCAIALDLFGTLDYLVQVSDTTGKGATWPNAIALVLLLAQPALLRRWGAALITRLEISGVTFLANLSVSLYVYWIIRPHVDAQGWMISAAFLSLAYLAYGAWTRLAQFILSGQIYLALSVAAYLNPPGGIDAFPWTWWAAAVPPATVFFTAWLAHQQLPRLLALSENARTSLGAVAYVYQAVALGLAVRYIFGVIPTAEDTLALFLFATVLLLWNLRMPSAFGARAALLVNLIGAGNYLAQQTNSTASFTWVDATAFALFLAQPAALRLWGRDLLTRAESWAVVLLSAAMAWLFVAHSISAAGPHNQTLGWALVALALTVIGFAANERRQRWCGLGILLAAILRVGVYDFWIMSDVYKVLTFFVLTVICLGLSFLYYKFADRLKDWL